MLDFRIYAKPLYVGFSAAHLTAVGSALNHFLPKPYNCAHYSNFILFVNEIFSGFDKF